MISPHGTRRASAQCSFSGISHDGRPDWGQKMLDAPQQLDTFGKLPNLQNSAIVFFFFFKQLQLLSNREANASSISYAANLAWQPS